MLHSKNTENIYGYTGKKSPSFNFVISQHNQIKKDGKIKQVVLKKEEIQENLIKKVSIKTELEHLSLQANFDFNQELINLNDYINHSFWIKDESTADSPIIVECILLQHDKGYSIKCDNFDYKFKIVSDGEYQEIWIQKEIEVNVCTTKIQFLNPQFPFHYVYEDNPLCDAIFNDYIKSQLSEIKPPNIYILPVKNTNNQISYRQYIGYMKTYSFINFKINDRGWYIESFINENDNQLVNGVDVKYKNYWIYHPRCSRIEHLFVFL